LILLAERGESGLTRQFASELLWPPADEAAVRHRFSQLLYSLNRRVGEGVSFAIADEMVTIREGTLASDLDDLRGRIHGADLRRAHALVEAGYAPGLDGKCSETMASWLEARRIQIRARLRRSAASRWSEAENGARWDEAGTAAEVMLDLDPDDEAALQHLIWARSVQGRVAEARAAFRSFVERARSATGDEAWYPSQDTLDLVARARSIGEAHSQGRDDALESPPPPPLVGRRSELARFARSIRRAPSEALEILLVSGEGGIGKTRLVEEGMRALHGSGVNLLRASSSEFEKEIQLGPILEALSTQRGRQAFGALDEPWKTVILGLLPDFHEGDDPIPVPPPLQPGSVPRRLFEALRQMLLALADQDPVVLVLDDAQWLDETSAAALDYLRRRWDSGGLTVVLVERPESRVPGSATDRLLRFLHGETDGIETIQLEPLPKQDAAELARAIANRPLSAEEEGEILALAGENPFFLIELTRAHAQLEAPGGHTRFIPIPESVEQVLRPRIERLSVEASRTLMQLSVLQDPIEPRGIGTLMGTEREACLEALEELTDARILGWERELASVTHTLIRETVYANLSPARLSWLHGRVGAYLKHRAEPAPAGQLALHFHRAGMRGEALGFALTAASEGEESGGVQEAIQYLFMALEDCVDEDLRTDILYRLGMLLHQAGRFQQALECLVEASARLRIDGMLPVALRAEVTAADCRSMLEGHDPRDAIDLLRDLRAEAKEHGDWEAILLAWDGELHIRHRMGDLAGASELLATVAELAVPPTPLVLSLKESILAISLHYGDPKHAVAHAAAGYELSKEAGQREQRLRALSRFVMVNSHQALLQSDVGALALEEAHRLATGGGALQLRVFLRINRGVWFLDTGLPDRAMFEFDEARRLLRETEAPNLHILLHYNVGEALLGLFEYEEALSHFQLAEQLAQKRVAPHFVAAVDAGIGMASLLTGQLAEARRRIRTLPAQSTQGHFDSSLLALFKARMLVASREFDRAEQSLASAAELLRGRWVTGWLKLSEEYGTVVGRRDPKRAIPLLDSLVQFAEERGLEARQQQIAKTRERILAGNPG
jgi:tetratricopeptide (TPR) repeat protein/DNA-binding SARP family transcriptional activator